MPVYAAILNDVTLQELRFFAERPADALHKNKRWLPVNRVSLPVFDPDTEIIEAETQTIDIPGDEYRIESTKRALTALEIDARKQLEVDRLELDDVTRLSFIGFLDLARRVEALEAALTAASQGSNLNAVKSALVFNPAPTSPTVTQLKNWFKARLP